MKTVGYVKGVQKYMPEKNNSSPELVSLIVPVYNAELYIESFYNQFKAQTYPDIELIFVNDGSKDGTSAMLARLAEADYRVVVYEKENGGPASARNLGKKMAKGKYLVFADVDDYILPDYVMHLYRLISENDADMSVCATIKVNENEDWRKYITNDKPEVYVFNNVEAMRAFAYRRLIIGYPYIKMFKTELANRVDFPDNIFYGEDYIYVYNVMKCCDKVVCSTSIQYIYIQYNSSSTHIKRDNTQKYQDAWGKNLEVLEDAKIKYPTCCGGIIGKCYLLAINNTTRIYDKKRDVVFLHELYSFIRQYAKTVLHDKEERLITRLLALTGMISPSLVSNLCALVFRSCDAMSLTFRHTM